MKRKFKDFIQHLGADIEDEAAAEAYLEESLPLVGMIVMYFNALEKSLDSLICFIISDRTDEPGLIVLQGSNYAAKVDLLKRFSESFHRAFEVPPAYGGLVEGLLEVGKLRNLVVHADWQNTDEEGFTYFRVKAAGGAMHEEYVQLTAEALGRLVDRIWEVRQQLDEYETQRTNLLSYGRSQV